MGSRRLNGLVLLGLLCVLTAGCIPAPVVEGVQSHTEEVDLGYSHPSLAPDIHYRVRNSGVGDLDIEQDDSPKFQDYANYLNEWDLALNSEIPLELIVTLGAGESELFLSDLNLESFTMQIGAGESTLDLSDYSGQNLEVDIQGGVGELTVFLPSDARIESNVRGGLGEINTTGLSYENGLYVRDYSGTGPVIEIRIEAGIGQLNLIVQ